MFNISSYFNKICESRNRTSTFYTLELLKDEDLKQFKNFDYFFKILSVIFFTNAIQK